MSGYEKYLQAAERVVAAGKERGKTYAGPCSKCRWSRVGLTDRVCVNPVVKMAAFEQTDDYSAERIQECGEQRDRNSLHGTVVCGPDGALFEPARSFLEWLFPPPHTERSEG